MNILKIMSERLKYNNELNIYQYTNTIGEEKYISLTNENDHDVRMRIAIARNDSKDLDERDIILKGKKTAFSSFDNLAQSGHTLHYPGGETSTHYNVNGDGSSVNVYGRDKRQGQIHPIDIGPYNDEDIYDELHEDYYNEDIYNDDNLVFNEQDPNYYYDESNNTGYYINESDDYEYYHKTDTDY